MKPRFLSHAFCLGSGLVFASSMYAVDMTGIDSVGSNIEVIDKPAANTIGFGDLESSFDGIGPTVEKIHLFYEGQTELLSDLDVYFNTPPTPGSPDVLIGTGTIVRSYLLHWDPAGVPGSFTQLFSDAEINFTGKILGFLGTPSELKATDLLHGPSPFTNPVRDHNGRSAGFGGGNDLFAVDVDEFGAATSFEVKSLAINGTNFDQIRVFTVVPEPTTVVGMILGLGLIGFRGLQRKRLLSETSDS